MDRLTILKPRLAEAPLWVQVLNALSRGRRWQDDAGCTSRQRGGAWMARRGC